MTTPTLHRNPLTDEQHALAFAAASTPRLRPRPRSRERILMVPPDHFRVDYVINPWMRSGVDPRLALDEWQSLCEAVSRFAEIEMLPPAMHVPDLVFCANSAFVFEGRAVLARFRHPERTPEEVLNRRWFESFGLEVVELPRGMAFEGTGDALFHRGPDFLWCGHGWRTHFEATGIISTELDIEVVPLELKSDRFYHLDTCLVPLPGGYLYYYPAAFTPEGIATIERRIPTEKRYAVGDADAACFACNAVWFENAVIVNDASTELERRLNDWGFEVIRAPLSQFMLSGGAAGCLTLYLDEGRAAWQVKHSIDRARREYAA